MTTAQTFEAPESVRPYYEWVERLRELFPNVAYFRRRVTVYDVSPVFWKKVRSMFHLPKIRTRTRETIVEIDSRQVLTNKEDYELERILESIYGPFLIDAPVWRVIFVPDERFYRPRYAVNYEERFPNGYDGRAI